MRRMGETYRVRESSLDAFRGVLLDARWYGGLGRVGLVGGHLVGWLFGCVVLV
jgi:hypothetical protein